MARGLTRTGPRSDSWTKKTGPVGPGARPITR